MEQVVEEEAGKEVLWELDEGEQGGGHGGRRGGQGDGWEAGRGHGGTG